MKKILILLTLSILFVSCDFKSNNMRDKIELLQSVGSYSSLNYSIHIREYLIKHKTNEIDFNTLDSLLLVSDKECDSVIKTTVKKIY